MICLSSMHGRQKVTAQMIRNTPVPIHMVYTTDEDGLFLDQFPSVVKTQTHNNPVSDKLITNLFRSKDLRWSKMTVMGSDDVMCPKAWRLVEDMLDVYEAVAFRNSYFLDTATGETYFGMATKERGQKNRLDKVGVTRLKQLRN